MQTLKDDIRQRIIATARAEFIAHGVRCTSIRTVARKSGVAVGNLYNYFSSKDELFCEVLRPLTKALNKHILSHNDEKFLSIDVFNMRQHQIDYIFAMLAIIKDFRPELRLLLFNSEGTSLQGYKDKMVDRQMKRGYGIPTTDERTLSTSQRQHFAILGSHHLLYMDNRFLRDCRTRRLQRRGYQSCLGTVHGL